VTAVPHRRLYIPPPSVTLFDDVEYSSYRQPLAPPKASNRRTNVGLVVALLQSDLTYLESPLHSILRWSCDVTVGSTWLLFFFTLFFSPFW